jgi:hypothetical protein
MKPTFKQDLHFYSNVFDYRFILSLQNFCKISFQSRSQNYQGVVVCATMARRLLLVDFIEAKNLIACERSGTSDPFIAAQLVNIAGREIKNEKFNTNVMKKTLSPKWEQRFAFGDNIYFSIICVNS